MTVQLDDRVTVRELVGHYPQTRPVFERYGIDYCCGGAKSLADAAAEHKAALPELIDALEESLLATPAQESASKDWSSAPLGELVEHILDVHHTYTQAALTRLQTLVPKVLAAHGEHHGQTLRQVQDLFSALDAELASHMMKEERILFPYIVAVEAHSQGGPQPHAPFGSASNPIRQMEHEHDNAGQVLARLREVTQDYQLPGDACPTFKAMYDELQRLEADLHEHIHLENNILFPRAIALEE